MYLLARKFILAILSPVNLDVNVHNCFSFYFGQRRLRLEYAFLNSNLGSRFKKSLQESFPLMRKTENKCNY
jgi:hypothetical protein